MHADAALPSLVADVRINRQLTFGARLDSELSASTQRYSGALNLTYAF